MRKQIKRFLLLAFAALTAAGGYAYDVKIDGIFYNLDRNKRTASVTYGTDWFGNKDHVKYTGNVSIPASITSGGTDYSVTTIGESAFRGSTGLTSVTIPSSVTAIGLHAFSGCTGLTSVTIPSSVTYIGLHAFDGCTGLTSIDVATGNATYSSVDGVLYNKDKNTILRYPCGKCGFFSIPSSVTAIGEYAFYGCTGLTSVTIPSSVTAIGLHAFRGSTGLTSVTIPSSVTTIGESAFYGCTGLTSIDVATGNATYSSVDGVLYNKDKNTILRYPCGKCGFFSIPSSVKTIGKSAFSGCTGLTSVTIPSSVTAIGESAFDGCTGLTSVTIPSSVTTIGWYAFKGCTGLTSVTISSSVKTIETSTFKGCTGLTSVTIPSSVTTIGLSAFDGCTGLTSVTIPSSVTTIGEDAFRGCVLRTLYWYGKRSSYSRDFFAGLNTSVVIYAYESEISAIKSAGYSNVYNIEKYCEVSLYKRYLRGISFSLVGNELVPGTLQSVKIGDAELSSDGNGIYTATGLDVATNYYIIVTYVDESGVEKTLTETVSTLSPSVSVMKKSTQTTLSLSINASSDETCTVGERGFLLNGETYKYTDTPVTVSGLVPNTSYTVTPYAWYGSKKVTGNASKLTTDALDPAVVPGEVGPTSFIATGCYTERDAHVSEVGFEGICEGNALTMTGLKPKTAYTVTYYVRTEEGSEETKKYSFQTSALELTTEQPRCVSSSCAVVAATTNISDEEPNVGFQWKKYDAPESLRPSEGYAAIYGGQLEGYIRNLQPTSYYNVRAFYKAADETYYYGKWVTFDPSDFSFFEPTVHTYPATEVSHSSVRVRGYVLAGTDDITEQGFQYWPAEAGAARAQAVQAILADASGNDVTTVLATGQVMTTVLSGLRPSTTYCCRAFVKTAAGVTYGEEQTFTTAADLTGIGSVEAEESAPTIVGYYDLKGHRFTSPQRGINIVRYSDGTTRKVFVK